VLIRRLTCGEIPLSSRHRRPQQYRFSLWRR